MSRRPQATLHSLLCHPRVSRTLQAVVRAQYVPPLLFAGQPGIGKRTAALLLAQVVNCESSSTEQDRLSSCGHCHACTSIARITHPDVRLVFPIRGNKETSSTDWNEIFFREYPGYRLDQLQPPVDQRATISIELARWIRTESAKPPLSANRRFFIVLHAHRLNAESTAALLKTMEETRSHTTFILCTDRPWLLTGTIRSRCRMVRFAPIESGRIADWLRSWAQISEDQVSTAILFAQGSPGEAVRYLESYQEPTLANCSLCATHSSRSGKNCFSTLPASCPLFSTSSSHLPRELFLVYRNVLRAKLGLGSQKDIPLGSCPLLDIRQPPSGLVRLLRLLCNRQEDSYLNTNPGLTSHTLIWLLGRFSMASARPQTPPLRSQFQQ